MSYRRRIYFTSEQKSEIWDHWQRAHQGLGGSAHQQPTSYSQAILQKVSHAKLNDESFCVRTPEDYDGLFSP